jgi:hypothetical protein
MGVKVTNNAYGTLSAGIAAGDTTITLDGGQGARFPTLGAGDYFYGTLVDTGNNIEVVKVTARSSDSMTVVRGQDNTTARAYAIGDRFELRPTAALFDDITTAIDNVDLSSRVAKTGDTMTGELKVEYTNARAIVKDGSKIISIGQWDTTNNRFEFSGANTLFAQYGTTDFTIANQTNGGSLKMDAYGRVTTPQQPAFKANYSGSGFTVSSDSKITHNREIFDVGGCFNPSNSRFTAPVAGKYLMLLNIIYRGNYTNAWTEFYLNGSKATNQGGRMHFTNNEGATWHSIYLTHIFDLSANDYIEVYNGGTNVEYHGNDWHAWSGYLLG